MKIGSLYWFNKDGTEHLVLVTAYEDQVEGRTSNFVSFRFVNDKNELGERSGDYYSADKFTEATDFRIKVAKVEK